MLLKAFVCFTIYLEEYTNELIIIHFRNTSLLTIIHLSSNPIISPIFLFDDSIRGRGIKIWFVGSLLRPNIGLVSELINFGLEPNTNLVIDEIYFAPSKFNLFYVSKLALSDNLFLKYRRIMSNNSTISSIWKNNYLPFYSFFFFLTLDKFDFFHSVNKLS